jgi:hypothetical protein
MGKKVRKRKEKASREELEKRLERRVIEAKKISSAIGLQVEWDEACGCRFCLSGLVSIICQYKEKGAIFCALSKAPECVFHNCNGELSGEAEHEGKRYAVSGCYVMEVKEPSDYSSRKWVEY